MNSKNLNSILLLLIYFAIQHDTINAIKRPHDKISDSQQNKQRPPALKKTKPNNKTATFVCAFCNKILNSSHNLTIHQRTHTGEKPYKCNMCDKSFGSSGNLVIHERIHTGEKPYPCDICEKSFGTSSNLTRHKITHAKTITSTINPVKNNTKQISTQITKDISLNTPTDYQDILEDIMTLDDTEFNKWIEQ